MLVGSCRPHQTHSSRVFQTILISGKHLPGWRSEPVFPSKIPQSGPAAEAIEGVTSHAAVATEEIRLVLDNTLLVESLFEIFKGSNDGSLLFDISLLDFVTDCCANDVNDLEVPALGTTNPFVTCRVRRSSRLDLCLIIFLNLLTLANLEE